MNMRTKFYRVGFDVANTKKIKFRLWVKSKLLEIQASMEGGQSCISCGHTVKHGTSGCICTACTKVLGYESVKPKVILNEEYSPVASC
jgi:hypothetical protein